MPKKLTVLGVLAALVLGTFGVLRDTGTTYAGPGSEAQNFVTNANGCYGTAPAIGAVCTGGSDTAVTAGFTGDVWAVATLGYGSRLTLPISYVPGDTSGTLGANTNGFGLTVALDGVEVGDVTAQVDIGCDSSFNDVLAEGINSEDYVSWPLTWDPVEFEQTVPPPTYVDHPFNWTIVSNVKAELTSLFSGAATIPIPGGGTPLNATIGTSPYKTGLRASVATLGGDPSAPAGYLCLDSPQNSSSRGTGTIAPSTAGIYVTWTVYTSASDFRTYKISRIIDVQCINVGGSGDSIAGCTSDADGDGVPTKVEDAFGTLDTVGNSDTDGDGSSDFDEMANGTRAFEGGPGFDADCDAHAAEPADPLGDHDGDIAFDSTSNNADDTDCDGELDAADLGADQTTSSKGTIQDTNIDDNCPASYNPSQLNSDSPRFNANPQPVNNDSSDPAQDLLGDFCDGDDDDDAMDDNVEVDLAINPAPGAGVTRCATASQPVVGYSASATLPRDGDFDDDGGLDGRECQTFKNPKASSAAERMSTSGSFSASEGAAIDGQETFYRNGHINDPAGSPAEIDDVDGDGLFPGETDPDTDTCATTAPSCNSGIAGSWNNRRDGILDAREVKFFGTRSSSDDSDGDGCGDGKETGDVTGNRNVDVLDLSQVAGASSPALRNGAGVLDQARVNKDVNGDGAIDIFDLQFVAARTDSVPLGFPACTAQAGAIISKGYSPQP